MVQFGIKNADVFYTPSQLTRAIRRFVGSPDIKISTVRTSELETDDIVVNGYYDPDEDMENFPSVFIELAYPKDQKTINISNIKWSQLCIDLIECIGHELIHQTQYRNRGYDVPEKFFVSMSWFEDRKREQEYLGNPDEIEAYGYSLAIQIYLKNNGSRLRGPFIYKLDMFRHYALTFGVYHPVVEELIRWTVMYHRQLIGENHVKRTKQRCGGI